MTLYLNTKNPINENEEEDNSEVQDVSNNIYFYTGVTKKSVLELNKKIKSISNDLVATGLALGIETPSIDLHINSPGGSLLDCFASIDYIRNSTAPVHSIIEGSAASAATLISVTAHRRSITKHSFMLIHQLSAGMWGKFESMKDEFDNCKMFMDMINKIYGEYTKIPKNVLKDLLKRDIYLDAKTCLKYGLVDKIIE